MRGFCLGLLTAALIAGTGLPAHARSALQQINVSMGGVSIFVDGPLQVTTDVKGSVTEPRILSTRAILAVSPAEPASSIT